MPRGGARPGSGPRKGTKYRKRLRLTGQTVDAVDKQTPAQRMAELRRQVALWIAGDMTPEEIAAVLGLSIEKLQALYPRELEHGRAITRAGLLARLDGAGNVAADKRLLDEIVPTHPPATSGEPEIQTRPDRPRGIGKKDWIRTTALDADVGTPFEGLLSKLEFPGKLQ